MTQFSEHLLAWYDRCGRKDLPWQQARNPYRVWVSEIMLQQTQVTTVIPYFQRFMQRFPDIASLAAAPVDQVLALWTGLGYYARARNLHRAAGEIVAHHQGRFPEDFEAVLALPGIGRSTAGAILAQAMGRRHPILDGNVKRVLARYRRIDGWPGSRDVEQRLWALSDTLTPDRRLADYTQAIMDLGATVCRRGRPDCDQCPVAADCQARQHGDQDAYPGRKPRKALPVRRRRFLLLTDHDGRVLLQRRPPSGVWGGLWSFPELDEHQGIAPWCRQQLALDVEETGTWPEFRHTFSHFHLDILPVRARLIDTTPSIMESDGHIWYKAGLTLDRGVSAPVEGLLGRLSRDLCEDR